MENHPHEPGRRMNFYAEAVRWVITALQGKPTPQEVKDLVRFLLDRGADPDVTDNKGNMPLMMTAIGCDAELLQMLLDAGSDPNARTRDGHTAIEYTFAFANKGADALIKAGARLPADKEESYKQACANNPAALAIIKRVSTGN